MKTIKKYIHIHIVILMFFVSVDKTFSQSCTINPISNRNVTASAGQITVEFTPTGGCGGSAQQYQTGPSWITFVSGGTSWFVVSYTSLPAGTTYRTGTIAITTGNFVIQSFTLTQGTPPPPDPDPQPQPCTITGFPTTIIIDPLTNLEKNYTLTFSNCSPEYLTFTTNGTTPLPSNNWFTITQLSSTSIRITASANNTSVSRSMIVVGTRPSGGAYISAQITQDKCEKNWYPDEDADTYGNAFAAPIVSCTNPSYQYQDTNDQTVHVIYVLNNSDVCPEVSGPSQGCPSGQVPENMNWITGKAFDLNGTLKASSKSYFDDLGKGIQSQSVDIKTNKTWASSTLYDVHGMPALSTLSAPINSSGTFTYKPDFIRDSGNATYNNADFETTPLSPTPIGTTANTLGAYYSNSNTELYQDITEYPFSRTIYSELNPGTALKVIGGNKQSGEWKQGYTFSMPAGQELSKSLAFGDPAYDDIKTIKTISKDVHGNEVVMFTDTDGKTLAAARVGGTSFRNTVIKISEQGYVDVHVPTGTTGFAITGVSGITTQVYNLITEQVTATATSSLPAGFYRISITNLNSYNPTSSNTTVHITCKENYYDYSLNEYDEVGRLIASYQPVGATKAQKPVTTYSYNALGQLVSTISPDEGTAAFKYRKDGQIRFSQNSKQLANTEFSYTNYDNLGRPIESGVYNEGSGVTFANSDSILDNIDNPATTNIDEDGLPNANCSERQFIKYDYVESSDKTYLTGVHSSHGNPTFLSGNVAKTSNDHTTTYYSYDVYGRVKWIVQNINGLGAKTIDYEYDPITGSVKKVYYQKNTSADRFIHRYAYHPVDNSLIKVETSVDDSSFTTHADYDYYETGALKRLKLAPVNNTGAPLQIIDYVYNLNGQLKAINPGNDNNDLFSMQIDYHGDDYKRSVSNIATPSYGEDQFNGNIKGIRWNNKTFDGDNNEQNYKTYSYYYNKNNWLENAVYGQYTPNGAGSKINIMDDAVYETGTTNLNASNSVTLLPGFHAKSGSTLTAKIVTGTANNFQSGDYNVFDITYDANGNIRTLNRNKHAVAGQNKMDQLGYVYNPTKPNQLVRVDDAAGQVLPGNDIGDQDGTNYEYNQIGQLVKNNEEGLAYVYNASGLVTEVKKNTLSLVKFFYNDRGHRVKKESYTINGGTSSLTRTDHYVRDASGAVMAIYEKQGSGSAVAKEYPIYGASRLGMFYKSDASSVYQLTDHLGNVRAVVKREGGIPVAIVSTDYYPFGMPMPNRNVEGNYRYGYQGEFAEKEGDMPGVNSFELRLWDSRIGRWLSVDPYGQYNSPYLGMGNNPINGIDPDGGLFGEIRAWAYKLINGGSIHQRTDGKWAWQKATRGAGDGDLTGITIEYKNFGYGGLGRFTYNTTQANIKGNLDLGFQDVSDRGVKGHSIKLLTADIFSFDSNLINQATDINYLGKDGEVRGRLLSMSVETGQIDLKTGLDYVAKDWVSRGIVFGRGTASTMGMIAPTEVTWSKMKLGVGRPYLESKAELTKEHLTIHIGLQEDWGKAITPKAIPFGIGAKLEVLFQSSVDWQF